MAIIGYVGLVKLCKFVSLFKMYSVLLTDRDHFITTYDFIVRYVCYYNPVVGLDLPLYRFVSHWSVFHLTFRLNNDIKVVLMIPNVVNGFILVETFVILNNVIN